jgi:hypothetical protein
MKAFIIVVLCFLSLQSVGQCDNCSSFEEALRQPEHVKSLLINPFQHKVTLDSIPVGIGKLVNAEKIYLSDHNITTIPGSIGNLQKLEELSFAGCQISELPEEIFQLKNLKELILVNNQFSEEYLAKVKARFKAEMPNTMVLISSADSVYNSRF